MVLPHLRVQHGGQQAVDVVLCLANLGEHGLGVVVTIKLLKRPDLLGLVRRIRQPAQVGEVVQREPVPALIPCNLDQRDDSQPLRIGVLESMSFGERDPCTTEEAYVLARCLEHGGSAAYKARRGRLA